MPYSLLGAHVNNSIGGLPETLQAWKPPLVLVMDHSEVWHAVKAASPNTVFVGRLYQEFEPDFNNAALDPIAAAQQHCDLVLPWAERMGETYSFWQGVNEPVINSPEAMQRYADFDAERVRVMDSHGYQAVVGSFSVGNPDFPLWNDYLPAIEAAHQYHGALALHEYAWPTLDNEWAWYLLRHRKVYEGAPSRGWDGLPAYLKNLPLLVTECGLDGLIELGHPPRGWRVLYEQDPDQYLQQLAWYDEELLKDPYVAGAAIYVCGVSDWQWKTYDIWPELAQILAQQATPIYRLTDSTPPDEEAMWAEVLETLDRIILKLGEKL